MQYPRFVDAPKENRTEVEIRAVENGLSDAEIAQIVEDEKTAIRYWKVRYNEMVPVLIKAIQELNAKVEAL